MLQWDRLPFLTTVRNGSASLVLAYNHLANNMLFSGSPGGLDTDDGSDMVNATSNVLYKNGLWKSDVGGHTKSYSYNVNINGSGCGCGTAPAGSKCRYCCGDDDLFVGNKCVGLDGPPSSTRNCDYKTEAVLKDNIYYLASGSNSSSVCPDSSPLEKGSKYLPYPDTPTIIALAKDALGLA